jgi:uncharacterized protein (TIRG00374 family)
VVAKRLHIRGRLPARLRDSKAIYLATSELHQFQEGVRTLLRVDVLVGATLLGFTYVTVAGFALYLVVLGVGARGLNVQDVLAVHYFSLAFSLIFPLPIDIGVAELSGVGAFAAVGYERSYAVGAVLVNRVLSLGSAIAIALLVVIVLHDEFLLALRGRDERGDGGRAASQPRTSCRAPRV